MMVTFARRMLAETDLRLLSKFVVNFGIRGIRSVEIYKRRLKRGEYFPPFLYLSILNTCNLRCQGCWVDVEGPSAKISLEDMNKLINDAKAHGNSYFGILGGDFMPDYNRKATACWWLVVLLAYAGLIAIPDAYYQAAMAKAGDTVSVLSHTRWRGGYVDVLHSETPVAVTRARRYFRVADGRGYSLACDARDDIYPRVSHWCDMIAATLRIGPEVTAP